MSRPALCVVSYLNSKPFVEGLQQVFAPSSLDIRERIPAACAAEFASGACQIGLIPAGALLDFPRVALLNRYCIGADGQVDSVFVFADRPIDEIGRLYLDPHSRTSNGLARILLQAHWRPGTWQNVQLVPAQDDAYHADIGGAAAGVVIGDRAIALRSRFRYVYDLAAEWKAWCGLPFVFAVWAYDPAAVDAGTVQRMYVAFAWGMQHRNTIADRWAGHFGLAPADARHYLQHAIDYRFDSAKQQALSLYLDQLAALDAVARPDLRIAAQ